MNSQLLKKFILKILKEQDEVLGEPDLSKEDERDNHDDEKDEQVVAPAVAGYTLPLGDSNNNSTPEKRKKVAKKNYGGKASNKKDTNWYK